MFTNQDLIDVINRGGAGTYDIVKPRGVAVDYGDKIYWCDINHCVELADSGVNAPLGYCVAASRSEEEYVRVYVPNQFWPIVPRS